MKAGLSYQNKIYYLISYIPCDENKNNMSEQEVITTNETNCAHVKRPADTAHQ